MYVYRGVLTRPECGGKVLAVVSYDFSLDWWQAGGKLMRETPQKFCQKCCHEHPVSEYVATEIECGIERTNIFKSLHPEVPLVDPQQLELPLV